MNTPITNAEAGYEDGSGCWKYRPNGAYVPADFARQLERDRARLLKALRWIDWNTTDSGARIAAAKVLASLEIKE